MPPSAAHPDGLDTGVSDALYDDVEPETDPGSLATQIPPDDPADEDPAVGDEPQDGEPTEQVADMRAASQLVHFHRASQFVTSIRDATLESTGLHPDIIARIHNPPREPLDLDSSEYNYRLSLELFLATRNASEQVYRSVRDSIQRHYPESALLSLDQLKARLPLLTGVQSIITDMCVNSCLAYTGPFEHDDKCIECGEPRWDPIRSSPDKKVARQHFHTIPLAPVLQALRRNPQSAREYEYLRTRMNNFMAAWRLDNNHRPTIFDDFDTGSDFINAMTSGKVTPNDTVLMISVDGAQLYRNKKSDAWFGIATNGSLSPEKRFTKGSIIPLFGIPGPKQPIYYDSYLAVTLGHLSAVQKSGITVYDAWRKETIVDHPFLIYAGADRVCLAPISGTAGHQARFACRTFCDVPGRHKPGLSGYFPAFLKPRSYNVEGCNHNDLKYQGRRMNPEEVQKRSVLLPKSITITTRN